MPYRVATRDAYPTWIGLIFVFNLIVGTGALTLPAVFARAGWALGFVIVSVLAFISFVTVTFVIETIACGNAVLHWRQLQLLKRDKSMLSDELDSDREDDIVARSAAQSSTGQDMSDSSMEQTPLFSHRSRYYLLDNKIELGEMAGLFFSDFGRILFYLCIAIYLYGDLSIYSAAVAKTFRDILCVANGTGNSTSDSLDSEMCWTNHSLSRLDVYRLALIGFLMLLGPFTFFNVQKTKYLQMCTVCFRWIAFSIMISIALQRIIANGPAARPAAANIVGIPSLFGACVYSFMCHHSLPSLIAPIKDKKQIKSLLSCDYALICVFYLLLAITGAFAFANLEDLYTLNFVPSPDQGSSVFLKIIEYFLALFPVFTLSASFPIIAITLRNNLQTLFLDMSRIDTYNFFQRRIIFPLLAITPPIVVTFFTDSLTSLVGFTGSYAGTGIQYLIPVTLVYSARKTCTDLLGQGIINEYRSPFRHIGWLIFVILWSCACVILVTVNFFTNSETGT